MNGSVYLIGGGEMGKGETRVIDDQLVASVHRNGNLVFFPTAAGDSQGYIETTTKVFGDRCHVESITHDTKHSDAVKLIKSASAIYIGGGVTELLIDFFAKQNFVPVLRGALRQGTIVAGMSAGAQALASYYIDEQDETMTVRKGWGLVPVTCLVHAHDASVNKAFKLYKQDEGSNQGSFVAIGEKAAWHVSSSGQYKVGTGNIWYAESRALDKATFIP